MLFATYAGAVVTLRYGNVASTWLGYLHEIAHINSPGEANMDLWNNLIGRDIAHWFRRRGSGPLAEHEKLRLAADVDVALRSRRAITDLSDPRRVVDIHDYEPFVEQDPLAPLFMELAEKLGHPTSVEPRR
jgi:FAD/FMN-containing dehydrogenase